MRRFTQLFTELDESNRIGEKVAAMERYFREAPEPDAPLWEEFIVRSGDNLSLLFARAGVAYSYRTGEAMVSYTDTQIKSLILERFAGQRISILAPLVRARKGHYRELFESIAKRGFLKVRFVLLL